MVSLQELSKAALARDASRPCMSSRGAGSAGARSGTSPSGWGRPGSSQTSPTVQRAFEERYGIPILLSYGATEFAGPVSAMTPELHAEWASGSSAVRRLFEGRPPQ